MDINSPSVTIAIIVFIAFIGNFTPVAMAGNQKPQSVMIIEYAQDQANENLPLSPVTSTLFEGLPQFKVIPVVANYVRAISLLKKFDNVCLPDLVHTKKREKIGYFSHLPVKIFPNMRLFISGKYDVSVAQDPADDRVNLGALFDHYPELKLQVEDGRAYGALDKILQAKKYQAQIQVLQGSDLTERTINMFLKKRTDAILAYPNVFNYFKKQQHTQNETNSYPLQSLPEVTLGYVLCSRTAVGKRLITAIDDQLVTLSRTRTFLNRQLSGYDKQTQITISKHYRHIFGVTEQAIKQ